jgi:hypothetical protein
LPTSKTKTIFARPIDADVNTVPENLQMEVIEFQSDLVLKSQFNNIALLINLIWGRALYQSIIL